MKQMFLQRNGDNSPTLLPQKWLLCLLTLLLSVFGTGQANAAETASWTVSSSASYSEGTELSSNTDLISVKLGDGTWTYNSGRGGITTSVQGSESGRGTYINITAKKDLRFTINAYCGSDNCDFILAQDWTVISNLRRKGNCTETYILNAGETYQIFGKNFKKSGDIDYIFFKSFAATTTLTVTFDANGGSSSASSLTGFSITLPSASKSESQFNGWYTAATGGTYVGAAGDTYAPNGDITLYAQYTGHTISSSVTVGAEDNTSAWWTNFSGYREIAKGKEYFCEFTNYSGTGQNWFNYVMALANMQAHGTQDNAGYKEYFVLRADNYGWGTYYNAPILQMKGGGAADFDQFITDLNGADVKSRTSLNKDGNQIVVYNEITNNGRTYIYTMSSKKFDATDKVVLFFTVDNSHIKFQYNEAWNDICQIRLNPEGIKNGTVQLALQDGTVVPDGYMGAAGTNIIATPMPATDYVFFRWGGSGNKDNPRTYTLSASNNPCTVYADFLKDTNWTLKTIVNQLYYSDGKSWIKNDNATFNSGGDNMTNEYDGAYVDANGTEMSTTAGLLFNSHVRLAKLNNAEVLLYQNGSVKIPVSKGEIVTFTASGDKNCAIAIVNANGEVTSEDIVKGSYLTYTVIANADGYITLNNYESTNIRISNIQKTWTADFDFEDGDVVYALAGTTNYHNPPVNVKALESETEYRWYSSDPTNVTVGEYMGGVSVKEGFSGQATITCVMLSGLYPKLVKTFVLKTTNTNISASDKTVRLTENGTYTENCSVTNVPEGATVTYSIVSSDAVNGAVIDESNGSWTISIFGLNSSGNPSKTVVEATCGALSCRYTITAEGFVFTKSADVYRDLSGSYSQTINVTAGTTTYSIQKYGNIADAVEINSTTGVITGLPTELDVNGGSIVVTATNTEEEKPAVYVLTVPYLTNVWNFYKENPAGTSPLKTGTLVNRTNPGAADLVQGGTTDISAIPIQPVRKTREAIEYDLRMRQTWMNAQVGELADNDAHKYWNYTFKTLSYLSDKKTVTYTNEPLFSYNKAVAGDNVRVVENTAGLIFNCAANQFGINDNAPGTTTGSNGDQDTRETDRAVLIKGYSSFTVPQVTEGYYIKIHWYRHAPDAGDQFYVTNAKDLDGKTINPNDKLRFTSCHYTHHNYEGSLILQAASTGDVTITIANANWTELYRIEVTDTYESDMRLAETHIYKPEGGSPYGTTATAFERDINNPSVYNMTRLADSTGDFGESVVQKLVSRVQTHAKGGAFIESPAELYFTGYAAQNNTWNGWMNNNVQVVFEGTASCDVKYDSENGISNILPTEYIRVGAALDYPMFPLRNVKGVGTIKLIARTITGNNGEPHYTLNKQVAYVPVGEYSVQEYPYTWDFTKYNTSKKNAYSSGSDYKTMDKFNSNQNAQNHYGSYATDMKMAANAAQDINGGYAYIEGHKAPTWAQRNKRFFAQGAQLALGDGDCHTILEAEGLRINLNAVNDANNGAVYFTKNGDETTLVVNGTITVPEVDKGMYVFVRSAAKPTKVTGATEVTSDVIKNEVVNYQGGFDNGASVTLKQADIPENVWVYLQETEGLNDVVITPAGAVEGIGVTKYFKKMVQFENTDRASYTTDSRHERIDYQNTGFFTKHDLKAYIASDPVLDLNAENQMDRENGTTAIQEVTVVPSSTEDQTSRRGILLCDNVEESTCTARPLLPLFVPACNIVNDNISSNRLIAAIGCDKNGNDDGSCAVTAATETTFNYVITNSYYNWDWTEKKKKEVAGAIDSFLKNISFVILREAGNVRPNSAYLSITVPEFQPKNEVKQLYLYVGESLEEDATAISNVYAADAIESAEPAEVYTLTGVKLQGIPAKKGVYVVNGKKVFIK